MFDKLSKLPFKLAHRVARKIQAEEDRYQSERAAREEESAARDRKEQIPAHELADVPEAELNIDAAEVLSAEPTLVDVRGDQARAEGHARDSEHMPEIEVMIRLAELPADELLVVYDNDDGAALRVARFLRARGFEQVRVLSGGLGGWRDAGGEVT